MSLTIIRNAEQVHRHLKKIAADPSKLNKETMVKAGLENALFAKVVLAALDPFKTYGVTKLPLRQEGIAPGGNTLDEPRWWDMIDRLASRDLSGHAARDALQTAMNFLTPESAELLTAIVTKDLRAGFGESTVNKAKKGFLPSFPYMRCCLPKDSKIATPEFWVDGAFSQEKADGRFANVNHDESGAVWVNSRQGTPMPLDKLNDFVSAVKASLNPGTQTHGELLVFENGVVLPREKSNGVVTHLDGGGALAANQEMVFFAWDQIPLSAVVPKGKYGTPYKTRLLNLIRQVQAGSATMVRVIPTRFVKSYEEAMTHYRELLSAGKEGTVVKSPIAIWRDTTSKEQIKLKLEVSVELRVVGFNEGTGKNVGSLGSLQCESACGLLRVDVSGRGDAMRAEVWENKEDWLNSIVTTKSNGIMSPSGSGPASLFLPIFIERRTDKAFADTLSQIRDQFEAAVSA